MKNKKGFTLIELLAVIIILGILMIIAIPSVTSYISDSRKSAYVDTAKEIVGATRNLVNEGKLGMYDTGTTYYIPVDYIKTENGTKSPYGEFTEAYVGVVYDGTGYKYYWISTDDAGQGVDKVTLADKLETGDIKSDLIADDIKETVKTTGIGNRNNILILQDGQWSSSYQADNNIGENESVVVYPTGKDKSTVAIGDIVSIGSEQFYVYKNDGNKVYLIAKYNLKVGTNYEPDYTNWENPGHYTSSDSGYGRQSSEARGADPRFDHWNGLIDFSSSNYWNGKVGSTYSGNYCTSNSNSSCAFVYDSNSKLKQYIDSYKSYLVSQGSTIKEARLLKYEEAYELGCRKSTNSCNNAPSFLKDTSFWLGSAYDDECVWALDASGYYDYYTYYSDLTFGIRPVIVI